MTRRKVFDPFTAYIEDFVGAQRDQIHATEKEIHSLVFEPLLNSVGTNLSQRLAIELIDKCFSKALNGFSDLANRLSLDPWMSVLRRFPRQSRFSEGWEQYVTLGLIRYSSADRDSTLGSIAVGHQYGVALLYTEDDMLDAFRIAFLGCAIKDLAGKRRWVGKGAKLKPTSSNILNIDVPDDVTISVSEYERRRPSLRPLHDEGLLLCNSISNMGFPIIGLEKPRADYLYVPGRDISLLCHYFPCVIDGSAIKNQLCAYEEAIQDIFSVSVDVIIHFFAALSSAILSSLPRIDNFTGDAIVLASDDGSEDYDHRLGFLYGLCHTGFLRFPRETLIRRLAEFSSSWASDTDSATSSIRQFLDAFVVTGDGDRDNLDLAMLRPLPFVYSSTSRQVYVDLIATLDFFAWIIEQGKKWYSTQHGDRFTLALKKWIESQSNATVLGWKTIIRDSKGKSCEVDLLVSHLGKLFAIECKAFAKSRAYFRGDPEAIAQRSNRITQAAKQAKVAASAVGEYSGESVPLILEESVPPNSGWI